MVEKQRIASKKYAIIAYFLLTFSGGRLLFTQRLRKIYPSAKYKKD